MSFRIVIEPQAYAEIDEAYAWIAQLSPEQATLWYFDITERIESLQNSPYRCALARENSHFPEEIRQLLFGKYRILFTVRDEEVHVLHVRHSARDTLKPDDES
jgi:plasmid stabilization system protein ParE